jgi:hypothetical protein
MRLATLFSGTLVALAIVANMLQIVPHHLVCRTLGAVEVLASGLAAFLCVRLLSAHVSSAVHLRRCEDHGEVRWTVELEVLTGDGVLAANRSILLLASAALAQYLVAIVAYNLSLWAHGAVERVARGLGVATNAEVILRAFVALALGHARVGRQRLTIWAGEVVRVTLRQWPATSVVVFLRSAHVHGAFNVLPVLRAARKATSDPIGISRLD